MQTRLESIQTAFQNLRPHVRPEGDPLAGNLSVAIKQAVNEWSELHAAPAEAGTEQPAA